jgi:hypothetical protein
MEGKAVFEKLATYSALFTFAFAGLKYNHLHGPGNSREHKMLQYSTKSIEYHPKFFT